jgi:hypothetical protein
MTQQVWLTLTARGPAASPISGVGSPAIAMRIGVPVAETEPVPAAVRRPGTDVVGLPGQP